MVLIWSDGVGHHLRFVKERSLTCIQMMHVHIKEMSHLVLSIGERGLDQSRLLHTCSRL